MSDPLHLNEILFGGVAEDCETLSASEGEIPPSLSGTYYLNGPANFRRDDFTYRHWLDGDGLVRALRFRDGEAEHAKKFVRTKKFTEEAAAGKPIYRAFGTAFDGDRLRRRMSLETPANVSIQTFGGRLFAFGEQALPWELCPGTLETLGECDFNRKLLEITPVSAHPKIDGPGNRLCNFGLQYLVSETRLRYWEFDENLECRVEAAADPGGPWSVHDFALSENFASFYLSPHRLDIQVFVRGGASIHDSLKWHPDEENVLLILPRTEAEEPKRLALGRRGYCLHLIQAFEEEEDRLAIDLIETAEPLYPQYRPLPSLFETVRPCAFLRIVVDTKTWMVLDITEAPQDVHLDFPALIAPEHLCARRFVWSLGMPVRPAGTSKYYDRIFRFDWSRAEVVDRFHAPEGCYLSGEPAIVSEAGDDSPAYLVCPMWKAGANESAYLIFDAFDLAAGPVAVLPLAAPSPLAFHSTFALF